MLLFELLLLLLAALLAFELFEAAALADRLTLGVVSVVADVVASVQAGVVVVVVSPILWGLEYTPAETPVTTEEVSRG